MKLSKWLPPGVALILLGTLVQDGSSTMIMGSMLLGSMAANTAMMLGKMSLGGLMMMMMSQQYGGGGGGGEQANSLGGGQPGLLASLGNLGRTLGNTLNTISGAASNTNKRTTRSHGIVSPPVGTATTTSGAAGAGAGSGHVRKVVRYSRPFQANQAAQAQAQAAAQPQVHPNHQSSYGQAHSAQAHAHAHAHHKHHHAHSHTRTPAVQDQVQTQSWPPAPAASQSQFQTPVQIQGYGKPALTQQDELFLKQLHEEIQRQQQHKQYRRRVARNVDPSPSPSTEAPAAAPAAAAAINDTQPPAAEGDEAATKKLITYTRLMRQADSFDYMSCLPKFVCGLEAQPPTRKTSILNDYSHLLKLLFGPDNDNDDDELDDELPSDEEMNDDADPVNAYRLAFGNRERLDDKLNDELIAEDPDNLKYVLKEIAQKGTRKNQFRPDHPSMGHYYPSMDYAEEPTQSSSILSSFLPKISAGFGSKGSEDPAFDDDPFFSGFKRSLDAPTVGLDANADAGVVSPTQNSNNEVNVNDFEDGQGQNVKRSKRISDNSRRRRKREAIEEIVRKDPVVLKYRRAQEIGRQSKRKGTGQRDCSNAFKNCPYAWDQIMGMISNMRNMILPNATVPNVKTTPDKVVVLQVPTLGGQSKKGATATKTYTRNGATKLTHDIGNGNVMQITVKLAPKVTGFEPVPVVESEPYQENDELDIPSVAILPKLKTTTTTTQAPKYKRKPAFGPAGELDPEEDSSSEEGSKEFSEEQDKVTQKLHEQNIGNSTRKKKPKRKFKPNPGAMSYGFADDVDATGLNGATILPKKGVDKVVHLKTTKTKSDVSEVTFTTTGTTTARPKTRGTTTTTIKPSGSAAGKQKGRRPVIMQEGSYKIKKRVPPKVVVELKEDGDVKPAMSYNSDDATTSEENDDESDDELDDDAYDDADAAEDEFILEDRDNYRSNNGNNKRRRPPSQVRPPLFNDPTQQEQSQQSQQDPMHVITFGGPPQGSPPHSGGSGGVGIGGKFRRPPFPMMMRQPPVMHDESKSWFPIGEQARTLSEGGQGQGQVQAVPAEAQQQSQPQSVQ